MLVFDEVELLDWIVMVSESTYYWRHRCVPKDYKGPLWSRKVSLLGNRTLDRPKVGSLSGFCPSPSV